MFLYVDSAIRFSILSKNSRSIVQRKVLVPKCHIFVKIVMLVTITKFDIQQCCREYGVTESWSIWFRFEPFIEWTESTSVGLSFMEGFANPAGRSWQRFNEFVEALPKMVQDGYAHQRFLDRSWENYSNIHKDQQCKNAGRATAESIWYQCGRWILHEKCIIII